MKDEDERKMHDPYNRKSKQDSEEIGAMLLSITIVLLIVLLIAGGLSESVEILQQ